MDARRAAAVALYVVAVALRLFGIFMCAVTIILCFSGLVAALGLVGFVVDLSRAVPDVISGYGVIPSPFGGVFRLDFAIIALASLALDYGLSRASRAIR